MAFYRLKTRPFLAEIWPKTSRNPVGFGPKTEIGGGRLDRGWRLYWRIYGRCQKYGILFSSGRNCQNLCAIRVCQVLQENARKRTARVLFPLHPSPEKLFPRTFSVPIGKLLVNSAKSERRLNLSPKVQGRPLFLLCIQQSNFLRNQPRCNVYYYY